MAQININSPGGLFDNTDGVAAPTDAVASATSAATEAEESALESEGFAVGEQNGVAVTEGEYFENNSKYYRDQASTLVNDAQGHRDDADNHSQTASQAAQEAETAADIARSWADGTTDANNEFGSATNNANYWANQASASATAAAASETAAETAEANAEASETAAATSETNASSSATAAATSATNAATSETNSAASETAAAASETAAETAQLAAEAARDISNTNLNATTTNALIAEGFAVGEQSGVVVTSGIYFENNAEYYAAQAAASAQAAENASVGFSQVSSFIVAGNNITIDRDNANQTLTFNTGGGTHPDTSTVRTTFSPDHLLVGDADTSITITFALSGDVPAGETIVVNDSDITITSPSGNDVTFTGSGLTRTFTATDNAAVGSYTVSGVAKATISGTTTDKPISAHLSVNAVAAQWYTASLATQPTALSSLTSQGAFKSPETDSATVAANQNYYYALPNHSAGYTFTNGFITWDSTNRGAIGSDHTLYEITDSTFNTAGTRTVVVTEV